MRFLTDILLAVCVSSVFIGALFLISPDGNLKNSVKYALSLVFIISVIASASFGDLGFEFSLNTGEPDISYEEMAVANAKLVYSETLKQSEINFSDISVFTDKDEFDNIKIIRVVIKTKESPSAVKSALGEVCNNIEVVVENE